MSCSDVTGLRAAIKGSSDGSRCDNLDWRRRKRTTVISFQCLFFAAARQQTKSNVCSVNARAASKHRHGAFTAKKKQENAARRSVPTEKLSPAARMPNNARCDVTMTSVSKVLALVTQQPFQLSSVQSAARQLRIGELNDARWQRL